MTPDQFDLDIESMPDVSQWQPGTCDICDRPIRWRWTNLKTVAATGDETMAVKEIEPDNDAELDQAHATIAELLSALQAIQSADRLNIPEYNAAMRLVDAAIDRATAENPR